MGETRSQKIAITDLYGEKIASIDEYVHGIVMIDVMHREIHEGEAFIVTKAWAAVGDDGVKKIQIETDSTTAAHLVFSGACGGSFYGKIYTVPTHDAGTEVIPMNMNLGSINVSGVAVLVDPSGGADGTMAQEFLFPGGEKKAAGGAGSGDRDEFIIPPNTKFMVEVKNVAGDAQDLWIGLEWYEVTS